MYKITPLRHYFLKINFIPSSHFIIVYQFIIWTKSTEANIFHPPPPPLSRDGIHESSISLSFWGIILRFLRLEGFYLRFCIFTQCYLRTNLGLSSLLDGFVWISGIIRWCSFLSGFPHFGAFVVSMGKRCIYNS